MNTYGRCKMPATLWSKMLNIPYVLTTWYKEDMSYGLRLHCFTLDSAGS